MTLRPLVAAMAGALALTVAHARDPIHSATRLAFADAGTLFVADWRGARIHALTVPSPSDVAGEPFNLKDVQGPIARALHVDRSRLRFEDMAAQPGTEVVYVALSVSQGKGPPAPALVAIDAKGTVKVVDLKAVPSRAAAITDAPADNLKLWPDLPAQSLTVTGMTFHNHKLYVAGLSNRTFASTLRVYDYPFTGKASAATVEVYHAVHDQVETRAPILPMAIAMLDR